MWGLERGYCLMIGGEDERGRAARSASSRPSLPGRAAPSRHPAGPAPTAPRQDGYLHCGPNGAGPLREDGPQRDRVRDDGRHRRRARASSSTPTPGSQERTVDAETTPLRDPRPTSTRSTCAEVAEVWRRGSVVGSWLVDLTADALARSPQLSDFEGRVSDSGEGRWTVAAAVDTSVPASVITAALYERFESRGEGDFTDKLLSAMRSRVRRSRREEGLTTGAIRPRGAGRPASRGSSGRGLVADRARAAVSDHGTLPLRRERRAHAVGDVRGARRRGRALGSASCCTRSTSGVAPAGDPDRNLTHLRRASARRRLTSWPCPWKTATWTPRRRRTPPGCPSAST